MLGDHGKLRWLVDRDLPQVAAEEPDILPISRCREELLAEAVRAGRIVATGNRALVQSPVPADERPAIVLIAGGYCTAEALVRNLRHFQFAILHERRFDSLQGQRFLIDLDRSILWVRGDGALEKLEVWETPSVQRVPAPSPLA
ncbi:MAG: hypothetical protein HY535_03115 [Chloroflexi bacterium]|nr:hypothetical protein [Chloroflexota bacterium]MBI4282751.1 hypothetical protein [Chloroflexota bacterium]